MLRITVCAMALSVMFISLSVKAATVSIACGAVGNEYQLCVEGANRWAERTGHQVKVVNTPQSANERLAMYQMLLREKHDTVDVFQIDVIWPGILHKYLVDLSQYAIDTSIYFDGLVKNNTVNDRLIALPWYVDVGLLYYRKDLLQKYNRDVPETWEEMRLTAEHIQKEEQRNAPDFWGYVWQGDDYEGLTCNVVEWLVSHDAGNIVEADGKITLANNQAVSAFNEARSWMGRISPADVLDYREEDVRGSFQSGKALFMRNWPYAWNLLNDSDLKGKVGVTVLPGSQKGKPSGALGGWQLAVTKASKHPELAVDLVLYLAGEREQRLRAQHGYLPSIAALYEQVESSDSAGMYSAVNTALGNVALRPSTATSRLYGKASRSIYSQVNRFLSGSGTADQLVSQIAQDIHHKSLGRLPLASEL